MAYVTLANLKTYRGITSTKDDTLLQSLVDRSQKQIEIYTGRVFESPTTASIHYLDGVRNVSDDKRILFLDYDLYSVTAVVNGDGTTVNSTAYVPEPRHATPIRSLRMKSSASTLWVYEDSEEDAIAVTGRWGYSASAPADIQQATIRLAGYLYAQKDASVFDVTAFPEAGVMTVPQGMPRDVREILDNYRRGR